MANLKTLLGIGKEVATETPSQVSKSHFTDPDTYYRVVTGDAAYQDILDVGAVRSMSHPPTGGDDLKRWNERLGTNIAPTSGRLNFTRGNPGASFSKGSAYLDAFGGRGDSTYVITTNQVKTSGGRKRHGMGHTQFPDEGVNGTKFDVFKQTGDDSFDHVYGQGKPIAPKPQKEGTTLSGGGLTASATEKFQRGYQTDNVIAQVLKNVSERMNPTRPAGVYGVSKESGLEEAWNPVEEIAMAAATGGVSTLPYLRHAPKVAQFAVGAGIEPALGGVADLIKKVQGSQRTGRW